MAANGDFTTYKENKTKSSDEETGEEEISSSDENVKIGNHDIATLKGRDKAADGPLELSVRGRINRAEERCCWNEKKRGRCRHCPDNKKRKRSNSCCLLMSDCRHRRGRSKNNLVIKVSDKQTKNEDKNDNNDKINKCFRLVDNRKKKTGE